jgi:hypothetical protein
MKVYFRDDCTLVIAPTDSVESMALKYWATEYSTHGDKLLDVDTELPIVMLDGTKVVE